MRRYDPCPPQLAATLAKDQPYAERGLELLPLVRRTATRSRWLRRSRRLGLGANRAALLKLLLAESPPRRT
jgi:hypothetical protein